MTSGTDAAPAPERPTRPALTRDHVLRTALALLDADGVDRFSMRRLGAALGVDPMAVYHWVPGKGAILDAIPELIWREVDLESLDPDAGLRTVVTEVMSRLRAALRAHPNAVVIVGTHPVSGPTMSALLDTGLGLLVQGGLPVPSAIDLLNCLTVYTTGHVLAEVVEPVGGAAEEPDGPTPEQMAAEYPLLAAGVAAGWAWDPDRQWRAGLDAMLDGWSPPIA
ncbi:MAG TPA: TetR/AcrR family transcriptional regulator C-terminal domain-containing protein [Cellulomonas sp.]